MKTVKIVDFDASKIRDFRQLCFPKPFENRGFSKARTLCVRRPQKQSFLEDINLAKGLIRIVLDILKPHEPNIPYFAKYLSEIEGVDGVNVTLMEIDKETENVKVTMQGNDLNFEQISEAIKQYGGSIHSVDEVVAGKKLVEEVTTPQD